jgi:UvrD/REP helicase N-terminal domain
MNLYMFFQSKTSFHAFAAKFLLCAMLNRSVLHRTWFSTFRTFAVSAFRSTQQNNFYCQNHILNLHKKFPSSKSPYHNIVSITSSGLHAAPFTDDNDDDTESTKTGLNFDPYEDYEGNAAATYYDYESSEADIQSGITDVLDEYDTSPTFQIPAKMYNDEYDDETQIVRIDENSPILLGLNSNQVDAVTKPIHSITRVIAGPGSGKTRVLTNRIAWLLQQNSRDRILAVTFTRKASSEMQERLQKLLVEQEEFSPVQSRSLIPEEYSTTDIKAAPDDLKRATLGTFHSVCTKILRWNGDYLATLPSVKEDMSRSSAPIVLDGNFHIMDPKEQTRIVKETLDEYGISLQTENLKLDQVLKSLSYCKSALFSGKNPFETKKGERVAKPLEVAQKIYYRFREKFLSTNSLDFDDLIYLSRELLLVNPDIRSRLQQRWQHIFVDEYQDTSEVQVELIKLLTVNSLFVVGDADQSIYAWRGAYAESLYDFEDVFKDYHIDGVTSVYLMENYRSTSKIVQAAQKVISLSSAKSGANKLRQKMIPQKMEGSSPRIIAFEDGENEGKRFLVHHACDLFMNC